MKAVPIGFVIACNTKTHLFHFHYSFLIQHNLLFLITHHFVFAQQLLLNSQTKSRTVSLKQSFHLRLIGENLLLLSWVNLSFQSKFTLAPNLIQMIRARFMALAQILQSQKMSHQKLMRTQKMIALKTSKFRRRNFIQPIKAVKITKFSDNIKIKKVLYSQIKRRV